MQADAGRPPRLLLLAALITTGCGADDTANTWTTTRDTLPGGVAHVVHVPPDGQIEPTWRIEEELRIGTRGGGGVYDPGAGFMTSYPLPVLRYGFIWSGAMLEDGRIVKPSMTLAPERRELLRIYGPDMS